MYLFIRFFILVLFIFNCSLFASVGKVSLLKGEATLQREAQKMPLKNGSVLEEKDIITTAKDTQIQLIFEDKTVITLGEESEFKIEEYLNDASKPKAKFKFGEGSFKTITGQIGKTAPENFTLETKTATIGIRGTTIQGRVGRGGDHIACLSGVIVVREIGSPNFVVVPAGKSTFVAPGTPPTPPQTIKPQSSGPAPSGDTPPPPTGDTPPPPSNFSSIVNQANNNDLNDRVKEVVTSAPVYNGFITSYSYDAQEVEHFFIGQAVSYSKHPEIGLFTFSAPAYEINPLTGALSQVSPSFSGYVYTDTDHYGYTNGYPNVTATPIANTSFSYFLYTNATNDTREHIWYDTQGEIAIYRAWNANPSTVLFLGPQSTSIPTGDLLYFSGPINYSSYDLTNIYNYEVYDNENPPNPISTIINGANKKLLSLSMDKDGEGLAISIGSVNTDGSINLKGYFLSGPLYDSDIGSATLNGAIYGSDNQAIAFSGFASYVTQITYEGDTTIYPKQIYTTSDFALRDTPIDRVPPSTNYSNVQILTGTLNAQNLDGIPATFDDLFITLKKTSGTVSINSSGLTIDETNSAYIHDNYFATLSTTTFKNTEVMKDYLMAIPYGSGEDDYVSWGYWGKMSYEGGVISTSTAPFGTWVAGVQTPTAIIDNLIATSKIYNYSGNVIGSVMEHGTTGAILNNANNLLDMNIKFGTSSITGSMSFDTSLNTSWISSISSAEVNPLTNAGFNAILSGTRSSDTLVSGTLNGKFYGPAANNVAGAFNLSDGAATKKVVGSFKAIKQIPAP